MEKVSFPGGDKIQQKRAARQQRLYEKEEKKKINKQMGPMVRLMIVRRGFESFLIGILLSICIGTNHWLIFEKDKKETSYIDAFKRAYDIRNLGSKETAFYPAMAMLMLAVAAAGGYQTKKDARTQAEGALYQLDFQKYMCTPSEQLMMTIRRNEEKYNPTERLNPVIRALVKKYASEDRSLFDNLTQGRTLEATGDYATTVVMEHLKKHPEDFQIVLDTFYESTLPEKLIKKYGSKTR